jgi:ABC-type branched-subunit amino acid transport system permease subunit
MARIVHRSRSFMLGVAFICVMGGTGGLIGALCGVILVLLMHTVLGVTNSLVLFMPASTGLGALTAMLLGVFLVLGQKLSLPLARAPLIPAPQPESK